MLLGHSQHNLAIRFSRRGFKEDDPLEKIILIEEAENIKQAITDVCDWINKSDRADKDILLAMAELLKQGEIIVTPNTHITENDKQLLWETCTKMCCCKNNLCSMEKQCSLGSYKIRYYWKQLLLWINQRLKPHNL